MSDLRKQLITRADDVGSTHASNQAAMEAFEKGVVRNASIMAVGPEFEEAAEMFGDAEGLCLGLHATLAAEWDNLRWGPVLGPEKVPSLVMADGTFYKDNRQLWAHNPPLDEIMAELKGQLDLARSRGLDIRYVDQHKGGWKEYPGLLERKYEWAKSEALVYGQGFIPHLSLKGLDPTDPVESFIARLDDVAGGKKYLFVGHPSYDDEETYLLSNKDRPPGRIARERDVERRLFTDPRIVRYFEENDVQTLRYTDLTDPSEGVL